MTRRRIAVAALAAIAAAGTFGASAATADVAPVRAANGDYIACAGLRVVPVATCVEEPVGPLLRSVPRP